VTDFEWDDTNEQANRKKHGVDFRAAAKVFLGPYVIEFDDLDAAGALRLRLLCSRDYAGLGEGRHSEREPPED